MAEYKDIWSSSPGRTPKLQLAAEQLLTAECWIPPKKDSPHPRAKEKPQQNCRRDKITFRIKPHTHQKHSEGSNKTLCTVGEPTETEPDLTLSVCMSPAEVWVRSCLLLCFIFGLFWLMMLHYSPKCCMHLGHRHILTCLFHMLLIQSMFHSYKVFLNMYTFNSWFSLFHLCTTF